MPSGGARRAVAALIGPCWLFGCAATPLTAEAPRIVKGMALPPYEIREDCVRLAQGDRLDYTFDATEPVAFEIRYREGAAALSPIARGFVRSDAGVYQAPFAREFCLVWEAGNAGALVDYRLRLRPSTR
ncbi:MAG: hypothetical protein ABI569_13570 [Casimicrobiaceae bacterium]